MSVIALTCAALSLMSCLCVQLKLHIYSLLVSNNSLQSVSHNPLEIIVICWFGAQETFLLIINVENICAAEYFCGIQDSLTDRTLKW